MAFLSVEHDGHAQGHLYHLDDDGHDAEVRGPCGRRSVAYPSAGYATYGDGGHEDKDGVEPVSQNEEAVALGRCLLPVTPGALMGYGAHARSNLSSSAMISSGSGTMPPRRP